MTSGSSSTRYGDARRFSLVLDSRRQDIAAGTLKAGDDRNAEWIGALEGALAEARCTVSVPCGTPFCARCGHLPAEARAEGAACGWRLTGLRSATAGGEP